MRHGYIDRERQREEHAEDTRDTLLNTPRNSHVVPTFGLDVAQIIMVGVPRKHDRPPRSQMQNSKFVPLMEKEVVFDELGIQNIFFPVEELLVQVDMPIGISVPGLHS